MKNAGVIFPNIDDHEVVNLRLLCVMIFVEINFVIEIPRITVY